MNAFRARDWNVPHEVEGRNLLEMYSDLRLRCARAAKQAHAISTSFE